MPTLFILCGLPFSGKTWLAGRIAEHTGSTLVSYDALWREKWREQHRALEWEELTEIAESRLAGALRQGRSAVYDTLNDTAGYRQRLRDLAHACHASALVVYVNTPLAVIRKRQQINTVTRERHDVSPQNFQKAFAKFEPPQHGENVVEFAPGMDLHSWLKGLWSRRIDF